MGKRLFIGNKPGTGPVLKVMSDEAYDPLTTPNTDYHKFVFNSEVSEIGYGSHVESQVFPTTSYSWINYPGTDYYYPNSTTPKYRVNPLKAGAGNNFWYMFWYIYPNAIWSQKNAFHFVMNKADNRYHQRWMYVDGTYPSSSDYFITTTRAVPADIIVPHNISGTWSLKCFNTYTYGAPGTTGLVLKPGKVGQSMPSTGPNTSGPYSTNGYDDYNYELVCYQLDLPVDNTTYPTVSPGSPVPGQKTLEITPTLARMAKHGFSVSSASYDQLIFDSSKIPMKVIKTGVVTIASGSTATIPLGATYSGSIFVDYMTNQTGAGLWVPPWPPDPVNVMAVFYKISGSDLILLNDSTISCDVRYIVMAEDDLGTSTGSAKVMEKIGSDFVIRRPGSGGTRLKDTIIDSRLPFLPIVSQGWVPWSSFVTSDTGVSTHMHKVTLSNPGGNWKPYVMAKMARRLKTNANDVIYLDPYAKLVSRLAYNYADSTFMIKITDGEVTFYASDGTRLEDAYIAAGLITTPADRQPVGLRYYIFAIPNSL